MLGTQVFLETYAPGGIDATLARETWAHFAPNEVAALLEDEAVEITIAERDGRAVGFAQLQLGAQCPSAAPGPAFVELHRLYVRQSATRQGVGQALLRAGEQRAAALGAACLWLTAWVGNARALAFYRAQGYADIGETAYVFEDEAFENRVFCKRV